MITVQFRKLSKQEELDFRMAARKDYALFTSINGVWHPVYQQECVTMNTEAATFVEDKKDDTGR
jgi:hypothetical protein